MPENMPRVMRLEEVFRWIHNDEGPVVVEINQEYAPLIMNVPIMYCYNITISGDKDVTFDLGGHFVTIGMTLANYNQRWRGWIDGIPTDDQRRMASWDEDVYERRLPKWM